MSTEWVMPSNHFILCHPLLLLPSIFSSIRVFSKKSVSRIRWPEYWSFSFSISPYKEYSGLTSFRMDWLDLLAVLLLSRVLPLFKPMDCGAPGLPIRRQLPELAQTRVCRVCDAIQPSLSSVVTLPHRAFNLSQNQRGHRPQAW